MDALLGREIILETRVSGSSAHVFAIDCQTGVEVSVITPVNASREDQKQLVLRKLAKALSLNNAGLTECKSKEKGGDLNDRPPAQKRGFWA